MGYAVNYKNQERVIEQEQGYLLSSFVWRFVYLFKKNGLQSKGNKFYTQPRVQRS